MLYCATLCRSLQRRCNYDKVAIQNFLIVSHKAIVRRADVVFLITTTPPMSRNRRVVGHAGIVLREVMNYERGSPIRVIHMTNRFVAEHVWQPNTAVPLTADIAGSIDDMEETERDNVITTAASFRRTVTLMGPGNDHGCYWQGDADPLAHPDYPHRAREWISRPVNPPSRVVG
jgi:hypothetical protein